MLIFIHNFIYLIIIIFKKTTTLTNDDDYILIGCDGVYEIYSNEDLVKKINLFYC